MIYLNAFMLGGFLCVLCQLALMFTKLDPPSILIVGFTIGAILTPLGIADRLAGWGGAGWSVMVAGAGQAVTGATMAALGGNPMAAAAVLAVFAALLLLGVLGGLGYARVSR